MGRVALRKQVHTECSFAMSFPVARTDNFTRYDLSAVAQRVLQCSRPRLAAHRRQSTSRLLAQSHPVATLTAPPAAVSRPDKDLTIPDNLKAVSEPMTVPGGKGRAVELKKGQYFKVTNTYGEQVGVLFARSVCVLGMYNDSRRDSASADSNPFTVAHEANKMLLGLLAALCNLTLSFTLAIN